MTFQVKALTAALSLLFASGAVHAGDLPTNLKNDLSAVPGISIGSDGSILAGNLQLVPLLPPGFDPSKQSTKLSDFKQLPDGSYVGGDIQFVPIQAPAPGELPQMPAGFLPQPGKSLPSDFKPPAGFVPNNALPLPPGVTVPPKSNADLVGDLEKAGVIPKGLVKFNSDGSMAVNGGASFVPFVPGKDQQGKYDPNNKPKIDIKANGVIVFPDGSQFAPVVPGSNPGDVTLPKDFTPPSGTSLPKEVSLPPQFQLPSNVQLPSGMTLPAGVTIPNDYKFMIPPGTIMPPGSKIPDGVQASSDVIIPPGVMLPPGTTVDPKNLPAGTQILPNGSVVVPGTQIPPGVVPPSNWSKPEGVVDDGKGGFYVPPPPKNGYPPPPPPKQINTDGSVVINAPANLKDLPPGATQLSDGSYQLPPPSFIGQVGSDGKVNQPTFGYTPPANYKPPVANGTAIAGTFVPTNVGTDGKVTLPPLPVGAKPPEGAVKNPDGSYTVPPPNGFAPPTQDASGNMTVKLPAGATPPPGATVNPDGTVTFKAPPPPPSGATPPPNGTNPPPPNGTNPPPTGTNPPPPAGTQPPAPPAPPAPPPAPPAPPAPPK